MFSLPLCKKNIVAFVISFTKLVHAVYLKYGEIHSYEVKLNELEIYFAALLNAAITAEFMKSDFQNAIGQIYGY